MTRYFTILASMLLIFSVNGMEQTRLIRIDNMSGFKVSVLYFYKDTTEKSIIEPDGYFIRQYQSPVTITIEAQMGNSSARLDQIFTHTFTKSGFYTLTGNSFNTFDIESSC